MLYIFINIIKKNNHNYNNALNIKIKTYKIFINKLHFEIDLTNV